MDAIELSKKAAELASKDAEIQKKIANLKVTIGMKFTDSPAESFTFSVDNGEIKILPGIADNVEFEFEITKKDYNDLMTGEQGGMILMATGKMKMVKGSWADINKVATPLLGIPKLAKEIAEKEKGKN
ncbi:MAG: SCP2 sterol-binding domain-containing protein [Candidatus Aenigmarchaeota archaeon]|nr:SCP2 sterol-binding domain-containing protein [Candidatus Aenigmarchaeota archaeon]